jgi:hypothetical protein
MSHVEDTWWAIQILTQLLNGLGVYLSDMIGFLKILHSVSIEIDVEYDNNSPIPANLTKYLTDV